MTGSTLLPKPFVHSLGDTSWVLLRANSTLGTQGARNLAPSSREHTQHRHWQGKKQGVVQLQQDRGRSLYVQRAPRSMDSAESEIGTREWSLS